MESDGSLKVMYDARRQARGLEPAAKPRRWRRRIAIGGGLLVIVGGLALGGYLWWVSGHVRTVHATVCAALVSVSPHTDARVQDLYVRPGDQVTAGQVLIRLDDSEARAALEGVEAAAAMARSRVAQAEATAKSVEARAAAELELAKAGVEIAKARVTSAQALHESRQKRLPEEVRRATAERDEAQAQLDLLKRGPRKEDLDTAKAKLQTAKALAELYAQELKQAEELASQGLEAITLAQTKRAQLTAQQGAVKEAEIALARLEAGATAEEVHAVQQALAAKEAALSLAAAGDQELKSLAADLAMRRAEQQQAEAQVKRAEAGLAEAPLAREQVKAAQADLLRADAEVKGRHATLAAMSIVSPVAGTVFRTFHRPGEVCKKGDPTILVVDDSAGRWVEGYIREEDAQYVKVGQETDIGLVTGTYWRATVEAMGLSTSSLGQPAAAAFNPGAGRAPGEQVWIRFHFTASPGHPLPGSSAWALIHVR